MGLPVHNEATKRVAQVKGTACASDIASLELQRCSELLLNGEVRRTKDTEHDLLDLSWRLILADT